MRWKLWLLKHMLFASMFSAGVFMAAGVMSAQAQSYDMDCKVILCLAGGFPSGCGDAKSYMFKRLRKGKAPFGICSFDNGDPYEGARVNAHFLHGQDSYYCPPPKKLFYREYRDGESSFSNRRTEVFCYDKKVMKRTGWNNEQIIEYVGKTNAQHVNFYAQVTVEPGTAEEYRSPSYLINTGSGFVIERSNYEW